jgi:hypothetical protein
VFLRNVELSELHGVITQKARTLHGLCSSYLPECEGKGGRTVNLFTQLPAPVLCVKPV